MRRLRWIGKEAVYVPRMERQMREGIEFEASDSDAAPLIAEGLAEEIITVQAVTRERHGADSKRSSNTLHVTVTDAIGIDND